MQNKTAIWVFTILLALACVYQLSFSFVTGGVEDDAQSFAEGQADSIQAVDGDLTPEARDSIVEYHKTQYLLSHGSDEVIPFIGTTYKKAKKNEINLGLDLQGGMNVILEVSVVDLVKALSGNSNDKDFAEALARAQEMQKNDQASFTELFGRAFSEISPDGKLAAIFHTRENQEKFPRNLTNEEILDILQEEADAAVSRTKQVLEKRIDNLGVVQPKIQLLEGTGRILVELPGVKDKSRVRKILQGTAKLEFWETYDNKEVFGAVEQANILLKNKLAGTEEADSTETVEVDSTKASEGDLTDALTNNEDETAEATDTTVIDSTEIEVAAEEDLFGTNELATTDSNATDSAAAGEQSFEDFQKENPLYAVMRPSYYQGEDGQYYPGEGPSIGYASKNDTAKVNEYFAREDVLALFPPRIQFKWGAKAYDENEEYLQLYAIKVTKRDGIAPLEGDGVADARADNDPLGNPEVRLVMTPDGAKTWKNLTKDNVGKSVAIVLDNLVYSAPTVQGEIAGGVSSISGRFTQEEVDDLSNVLKAGKLPAPARIIEEAIVGPSLGEESISDGLQSFLLALIIILAYMVFYYNRAGMVADVALLANIFFVMGVLASIGATLTLPGIAGIVLTIGMSVDANVLIYERIREELAQGKGIKLAIADGYKAAYSSIIDANITTLLTGIILLVFGTGPIKGFATTLIIGILTSLFSAIFITRLIFDWQLEKKMSIDFATKLTKGAFKNMNVGFVAKRRLFYMISGILILVGIGSIVTRGFNLGVDFSGGRSYVVRFDQDADVTGIKNALGNTFVSEDGLKQIPEVKVFGSDNQVKVTTKYLIDENGIDVEEKVEGKLNEGLAGVGEDYEIMSSIKVGPTIADDIKVAAGWAVLFSLIVIFLYILIRFRKWQYGLGALVAMTHDVLIVLAIFSLFYGILPFSLEIDQAFIAAILTVVGYSINDTVVVFDRIREYLGLHKKGETKSVINDALNSTLSRTFNTSISTFFVLLMIFIFGGEVIRGFVFALMVGVVVGTYSSVCIATPIVVDLYKDKKKKK